MLLSMRISKAREFVSIPKESEVDQNLRNAIKLQLKGRTKKVLLFDLDETLIHLVTEEEEKVMGKGDYKDQHEVIVTKRVDDPKGKKVEEFTERVTINVRPHVREVMKRLSQSYALGVFTASDQSYADEVMKLLDPERAVFAVRLYRQHCSRLQSSLSEIPNFASKRVKDLRVVEAVPLSQIVLVDNSPVSYLFQPGNAVPIIPFTDNDADDQLPKVETLLNGIRDCDDVRVALQ
jgi:Dullard-like phosphatase family protein